MSKFNILDKVGRKLLYLLSTFIPLKRNTHHYKDFKKYALKTPPHTHTHIYLQDYHL